MSAGLDANAMSVRYGGVKALTDVAITIEPGELVGLIGPNGAGKTTFIDAVTGFTRCSGTVRLDDRDLSSLSPERRARAGLARTWQSGELFDDLTVIENLDVASVRHSAWTATGEILTGRRTRSESVTEALDFLGLSELAHAWPTDLSQGQRKLVGVARAIAAGPSALCLDEPAAGLDTRESAELGAQLRKVADRGIATLLVDHDMSLVLSISDRVVVLDFGAVIASGSPEVVRGDARVVDAYLGAAAAAEVAGELDLVTKASERR